MSVRNDHDPYAHDPHHWALARQRRQAESRDREQESFDELPKLGETLAELGLTLMGFVGVILLVYAVLGALR